MPPAEGLWWVKVDLANDIKRDINLLEEEVENITGLIQTDDPIEITDEKALYQYTGETSGNLVNRAFYTYDENLERTASIKICGGDTWERGSLNNGIPTDNQYYLRSKDFIDIDGLDELMSLPDSNYALGSTYQFMIAQYSGANDSSYISTISWKASYETWQTPITLATGTTHIKVVVRHNGATTAVVTTTEMAGIYVLESAALVDTEGGFAEGGALQDTATPYGFHGKGRWRPVF